MSENLVNLFVQSEDQDAVAEAVMKILRPDYSNPNLGLDPESTATYVAPSISGWVGIFDLMLEGQDEHLCERAVRQLSGAMGSVAISFLLYEQDVVCYWLGRCGRLLDIFHSRPDYFGKVAPAQAKRWQGRPLVLAEACGQPLQALSLARLLRHPPEDGLDLICELYNTLDIPNLPLGYYQLEEEGPGGYVEGWESFRAIRVRELLAAQIYSESR